MTTEKDPQGWRRFAVVAALVVAADQISKWMAVSALTKAFSTNGVALGFGDKLSRFLWDKHPARDAAVSVLDNFWHFRYVENPGAAWGFLSGSASSLRTPFFLMVSLVALAFIIVYYKRTTPQQQLLRWGLSLVFGGAIGNFLDRVRLTYVIDFIDWHWFDKATWPTFNVADSAISIGVVILLIEMFLQKPQEAVQSPNHAGGRAG